VAFLVSNLIAASARRTPDAPALVVRHVRMSYRELDAAVERCVRGLLALGIERHARVAVYLPKQLETVVALFGAARAGAVFVPVNPILKPPQVEHILRDCNVRVLVTSAERLTMLGNSLAHQCPDLEHVVLVGDSAQSFAHNAAQKHTLADQAAIRPYPARCAIHAWEELLVTASTRPAHRVIDQEMAAILYTSGSTGKPKGVVLSHRNLVAGAGSVAQYLDNRPEDRLLAVLPLSFDYGLSQLTTAFSVGASVVLMDHLFARDVLAVAASERITGLAAVPPLWSQLAELPWPAEAVKSLRYITNSGGSMPRNVLDKLRVTLPETRVFLMYGLTEAFRATYLSPEQLDQRPDSIGKAIPNTEVDVVRPDGSSCEPGEHGELIQRGALVSLGYWNAPEATAERFRQTPNRTNELAIPEIAVWSGDTVRRDADGYLYFVARRDEQIKTSGYRVSPTEIESAVLASGHASEAIAFGVPHPTLGQVIAVVATSATPEAKPTAQVLEYCRQQLPAYMVPAHLEWQTTLPRNANGKYDRALIAQEFRDAAQSD
jgi:acyl-CoA ligase (AMP-forming) (exosortase A-associated)